MTAKSTHTSVSEPQRAAEVTFFQKVKPHHIVLAAIAIGFVLRFLGLGSKSIWLDEGLSIRAAGLDWDTFISGSIERYHPPLFFLILRQVMKVGTNQVLLRAPAALAGGVSVCLIYVLTRRVFDEATALSATWFAALSPLLIWYSQEIRGYSLLVMWALLSLFALAQLTLRRGWAWWLLFALATIGGLYTHYTFVLTLPVQIALVAGLLASKNGTPWAIPALLADWAVTGLSFIPWLKTPAGSYFVSQLQSDRLYYNALTAGRLNLPADLDYMKLVRILALAGVVLIVLGAFLLYRLLRRRSAWFLKLRDGRIFRVLAIVFFITILVVSVIPRGYTLKRYTHVLWFLVPIAFGWIWPWGKRNGMLLKSLIPLALLASLINVFFIPKAQWKQAAQWVLDRQQPGDVVLLAPYWMNVPFGYYTQEDIPLAGIKPQDDTIQAITNLANAHPRIWMLYHVFDADATQVATVQQWLTANGDQVESRSLFRLRLYLFEVD